MAQFAPVAPARILEQYHQKRILGEYHLILAHDIVHDPLTREIYRNVFGERDWDGMVILDNSVIELGNAVNLDIIAEAAKISQANVIVLPDVLEQMEATVQSITKALPEWLERFDLDLGDGNYRFMMVPQGKTINEWKLCAAALQALADEYGLGIVWGVPRNLVKLHGSRQYVLEWLTDRNTMAPVHLLGFSDNVQDDIYCATTYPIVTGIDSAVPIRAASMHMTFEQVISDNGITFPPRADWWDRARWMPQMADNLLEAREVFRSK